MKQLLNVVVISIIVLSCVFSFVSCKDKGCDSPKPESNVPDFSATMSAKVITVNVAAPTTFRNDYILYSGQTPEDYTMRKRFIRLCTLMDYFLPDVLMLQEVNGRGGWWDFLIDNDDSFITRYPKYGYVGTTNLAGGKNGGGNLYAFYNQIYYNKNKFELVASGTFFCRDDKNSPENFYTGDYEGVYSVSNTTTCSWAVLRDKATKIAVVYGTTHLCTRPDFAQCFRNYGQARNLTEGLYGIAEQYKWGDNALPIVVGGDFNGYPSANGFFAYNHMTVNACYIDSKMSAPEEDNSGTARIFGKTIANNGNRIDYIFHQGGEVTGYNVLAGTFIEDKEQTTCEYNVEPVLDGSQYDLTDHLPVYAKIRFSGRSCSKAPNDYVNPEIADDVVVVYGVGINATSTKIVFDSPEILAFVGNNANNGFAADIVTDGVTDNRCLRLVAAKSRIDPIISIDYAALTEHLGLTAVTAEEFRRIKIEYRLVRTEDVSIVHFGVATANTDSVSIGVNTAEIYADGGQWTSRIYDFAAVGDAFWTGEISYFGITTGVGLMAGDGIYIKSIELLT